MKKLLLLILICPVLVSAQGDDQLSKTILQLDSIFWKAYNNCDVKGMEAFYAKDLEFYHDKGGITLGPDEMTKTFQNNICARRETFRLRREEVAGTVKVFPMKRSDTIYGAILVGEHLFYGQEKGRAERADGWAKFTHLWLLDDGKWKMKRILSYDHQPAPQVNKRQVKSVDQKLLDSYAGKYSGAQTANVVVTAGKDLMHIQIENNGFDAFPESDTRFFMKERDLTFEFVKKDGAVTGLKVWENGKVAEELKRVK